jgi:hypothetical protein
VREEATEISEIRAPDDPTRSPTKAASPRQSVGLTTFLQVEARNREASGGGRG